MSATDTIRIRLEPQLKDELQEYCAKRGTTISQEIRDFIRGKMQKQASAIERFDLLTASAERKLDAAAVSEPTIDELNLYIATVRQERKDNLSLAL